MHAINPVRLNFLRSCIGVDGLSILDVGCGGGIFSEELAKIGGNITAIDLSDELIQVALSHSALNDLKINYQVKELKHFDNSTQFDVICCMEMIEHVDNPNELLSDIATRLKPGGILIGSTLTRTPLSFALAIVAAEHLLGIIPKGTHSYEKFLLPSEINTKLQNHGLSLFKTNGINYNPLTGRASLSKTITSNYIFAAKKND